MTVNVAKTEVCSIFGPFDVDSICAAFGGDKVIPYSELELLGSPISRIDSPDQLSGSVEIRLEQIATLGQSLQGLSSHHRLFLLKHCVGIPRLLYMIRSSPCFLVPEVLRNIDASFHQFLTETLNIQLDDKAWRQASLPVKAGGLGVRRIEDLALPAYLSSSSASEALVLQIAPSAAEPFGLLVSAALEAWSAAAGNGVDPPTQPSASRQSSWDTPLVTHAHKDLLSGASDQDALRLRSVSAEDVGEGGRMTGSISIIRLRDPAHRRRDPDYCGPPDRCSDRISSPLRRLRRRRYRFRTSRALLPQEPRPLPPSREPEGNHRQFIMLGGPADEAGASGPLPWNRQ